MSDDIYSNSSTLANLISLGVKEAINQARALGLTWTLRLATVGVSAPNALSVVYDGDTASISATNLTGDVLLSGQRVCCFIVPPSGNFIIGNPGVSPEIGVEVSLGGQSLPDNSSTPATWTASSLDSAGFISVPATSITIPSGFDGIYALTANALIGTSGGARNFVEITSSGGLFLRSFFASTESFASVSGAVRAAAGEFFGVNVFQNSGGATTMNCNFSAYRIG